MTTQPALFDPGFHAPVCVLDQVVEPYTWAAAHGWRTSTLARCRRCRAKVLRGHDDDSAAVLVDADPTPLTVVGELLALVAGRRTYTATRANNRLLLTRRSGNRISEQPAEGQRLGQAWDVVPAHRCGSSPLPSTYSRLDVPTALPYDSRPGAPAPF